MALRHTTVVSERTNNLFSEETTVAIVSALMSLQTLEAEHLHTCSLTNNIIQHQSSG